MSAIQANPSSPSTMPVTKRTLLNSAIDDSDDFRCTENCDPIFQSIYVRDSCTILATGAHRNFQNEIFTSIAPRGFPGRSDTSSSRANFRNICSGQRSVYASPGSNHLRSTALLEFFYDRSTERNPFSRILEEDFSTP